MPTTSKNPQRYRPTCPHASLDTRSCHVGRFLRSRTRAHLCKQRVLLTKTRRSTNISDWKIPAPTSQAEPLPNRLKAIVDWVNVN